MRETYWGAVLGRLLDVQNNKSLCHIPIVILLILG
jgi:hypothetical protein